MEQAFPSKNDGYEVNNVTCENGATAEWNIENWGLVNINSNGTKKIKCNIDFKEEVTLVKYLKNLNSEELVEDEYGNLRYVGNNPNNYVSFNNELWRIIGVMKDIENPDGTKDDKVKIIRNESIGKYSFDNKGAYGKNNWPTSALQKVLNEGAYYNRTSGNCPSGKNKATETCDFSNTGLTEEARNIISESVWNLGGSDLGSKTAKEFYQLEREIKVYSGHATRWTGNVGLMYPSDYGYATNGGDTTNREDCLNTFLVNWSESEISDCKDNNWLYNNSSARWTLMPVSKFEETGFYLSGSGQINGGIYVRDSINIQTVVYLNPKVKTENRNDASSSNPFILK